MCGSPQRFTSIEHNGSALHRQACGLCTRVLVTSPPWQGSCVYTLLHLLDHYALPAPAPLSMLCHVWCMQVQQLDIHNSDALQFTALSSLTALHMNETAKVGDLAVSAIICRLPRLQKLLLWGCKLESPTLWPVCATATQLVHLELGQAPVLSEESLQLLLPLQQLTYLFVGGQQGEENVSTGAWQAFIDAMPVLEEFEMP